MPAPYWLLAIPLYHKGVNTRAGYTLVELLVVIVISAFLSTAMIVYSSKSRTMLTVTIEKATLAQVLQRARSLAISTYNQPSPPCAVGVAINYVNNSYSLERVDSVNCVITNLSGVGVTKTVLENFSLNPQVRFKNVSGQSLQYVMFVPPEPTFQPWLSDIATTSAGILVLTSGDGTQASQVKVSEFGQINF